MPSMPKFVTNLGRVFEIRDLRKAYNMVFRSPAGAHYVLPDLSDFCRAAEPAPRESDLFIQGRAAGRRDVYLRIMQHTNLTEEELFAVHSGRSVLKETK